MGAGLGIGESSRGLPLGTGAQLTGLAAGVGQEGRRFRGAALGEVLGIGPRAGQQGIGLGVGLGQHGGALLLGAAQQLLDPRAQAGVGRLVGLPQATLSISQLAGQRHGALVKAGDLTTRVGQLARELLQFPINLSAVVAAHRDGKFAVFLSHVGFLLLASRGRSPPAQA